MELPDKRTVTAFVVKTLVAYGSASVIKKTLVTTVPKTQKFHTAEIVSDIGGWYIAETLEPHINQAVDDGFTHYEARQGKLKISD